MFSLFCVVEGLSSERVAKCTLRISLTDEIKLIRYFFLRTSEVNGCFVTHVVSWHEWSIVSAMRRGVALRGSAWSAAWVLAFISRSCDIIPNRFFFRKMGRKENSFLIRCCRQSPYTHFYTSLTPFLPLLYSKESPRGGGSQNSLPFFFFALLCFLVDHFCLGISCKFLLL